MQHIVIGKKYGVPFSVIYTAQAHESVETISRKYEVELELSDVIVFPPDAQQGLLNTIAKLPSFSLPVSLAEQDGSNSPDLVGCFRKTNHMLSFSFDGIADANSAPGDADVIMIEQYEGCLLTCIYADSTSEEPTSRVSISRNK